MKKTRLVFNEHYIVGGIGYVVVERKKKERVIEMDQKTIRLLKARRRKVHMVNGYPAIQEGNRKIYLLGRNTTCARPRKKPTKRSRERGRRASGAPCSRITTAADGRRWSTSGNIRDSRS